MQAKVVIELLRNRNVRTALLVAAFLVVSLPVLVAAAVVGLFAHEAEVACRGAGAPGAVDTPAGGGPIAAGLYAAPLELRPGRWYEVGATDYGGPGDPSSATTARSPTPASPTCRRTPTASPSCRCSTPIQPTAGRFTFADAECPETTSRTSPSCALLHDGREAILLPSATLATDKDQARSSPTGSPTAWTCGGRPPAARSQQERGQGAARAAHRRGRDARSAAGRG